MSLLLCLLPVYALMYLWSTVKRLYNELEFVEESRIVRYNLGMSVSSGVKKRCQYGPAATDVENIPLINNYAARTDPKMSSDKCQTQHL